jgi:hypothetical protein
VGILWQDLGVEDGSVGYRLDQLGWLQFEQLASLVLDVEAGLRGLDWRDRAYRGRFALVDESVVLSGTEVRVRGPLVVAVVWVPDRLSLSSRLSELVQRFARLAGDLSLRSADRVLVITNLNGRAAERALTESLFPLERFVVFGARELTESVDRHAALRLAMPSVLGLRDLGPLISPSVRERSSLDVERARGVARVFVPTRAYERSREVLARHRFVVLTGPPEMGKTAIAQMVALAQMTAGWEAHDCVNPDQVWRAFDGDRPQVFVADDAFGSTEYRPDSAEHWARELGRILAVLDERHWLIWTSRPAPLKSGLRRVQRERGAERFPAPGEVLVDASDLDLAEKTLILFRHVKDHAQTGTARRLVRAAGVAIVEHDHFTPERIRRFVTERLDQLVAATPGPSALEHQRDVMLKAVEQELATPTQQMATSFRALEEQHRALLIALLDTPAGLTDERELAATLRRHYPAGLSRPPHELIDRLTDHFVRISSLGIDWVHPSWRDLVIEQLRADRDARQRFLRACGPYGAALVLSSDGGVAGERLLPLLIDDADWDAFTDRVGELLREFDDADLSRLLLACNQAFAADLDTPQTPELRSLAEYLLAATRRSWDKQGKVLPVFLLEAWYTTNANLPQPIDAPQISPTWAELHPASTAVIGERRELQRSDDWLALAQTLTRHDPAALEALGFPHHDTVTLIRLSESATKLINAADRDLRSLAEQIVARLSDLVPDSTIWVGINYALRTPVAAERWWVPEDIDAPPTTDRVAPTAPMFTRDEVDQVLSDL